MKVHARSRADMPLLGVFATRIPYRPNPIGITLVELLGVKGDIVTVRGLDAFDGAPVLDTKPFDYWDMAEDARVPEWWMRMERVKLEKSEAGIAVSSHRAIQMDIVVLTFSILVQKHV